MSFRLTILGSSSAIPSVNRNPTSQLLNVNERCYLIDCGEGTQVQLRKYELNFQRINHIFISHLHGDHYFGLIGLISSMHLLGRNKDLHIHAHKELEAIIEIQLQAANTDLNYPLFFHPLPENDELIIHEDDNIKVSNIILDHTIKCSGFLFEEKKFSRKIVRSKVEEYNIPHDKLISLQNGSDWINSTGEVIKNKSLTTMNTKPKRYAFCTDTRYSDLLIEKFREIDLLYYETTFKEDMLDRARQTGHSTTFQAASLAKSSKAKNLLIGHYSKRYKDTSELLIETKKYFKNTFLSKSGMVLDFKQF